MRHSPRPFQKNYAGVFRPLSIIISMYVGRSTMTRPTFWYCSHNKHCCCKIITMGQRSDFRFFLATFFCLLLSSVPVVSFCPPGPPSTPPVVQRRQQKLATAALQIRGGGMTETSTQTFLMGPATASVLAGSVAGAIGVGVAFPLDTLVSY
jgi:hypothetical protein